MSPDEIISKVCFKCGVAQSITEFYRHRMMGDGHLGKCKVCTRKDVRENYEKRRDYYLAYEKKRYGPERVAGINRSKLRHPEREMARAAMSAAIAGGRLERKPCEVCGAAKSEGHHEDYTKWFGVRWLCRRHHREVHRMDQQGAA